MPERISPPLPVPGAGGTSLAGLSPVAGLVPAGDSENCRTSACSGSSAEAANTEATDSFFILLVLVFDGGQAERKAALPALERRFKQARCRELLEGKPRLQRRWRGTALSRSVQAATGCCFLHQETSMLNDRRVFERWCRVEEGRLPRQDTAKRKRPAKAGLILENEWSGR